MGYTLYILIFFTSILQFTLTTNEHLFNNFKVQYRKTYVSNSDLLLRKQIFAKNLEKIEEHNARFRQGLVTYEMGVNQFSDLTSEEFRALLGTKEFPLPLQEKQFASSDTPPDSIDWRELGAVTEVKNQGSCGGCWSFSTTGTLEGLYQQKYGELLSFSEQQLLDCDDTNAACDGGVVQYALKYVAKNGLKVEDEYPYQAEKLTCQTTPNKTVKVYTKGYVGIPAFNETALKNADQFL
ncbi:hypothetical protein ABEB36_004912 [Hypothenemus hampei]|uniref:Uncharacterized protein n=1 Tax=Hypothenemus hampei TaxID=57062 RepID=A0ABD1EW97_HYPHA